MNRQTNKNHVLSTSKKMHQEKKPKPFRLVTMVVTSGISQSALIGRKDLMKSYVDNIHACFGSSIPKPALGFLEPTPFQRRELILVRHRDTVLASCILEYNLFFNTCEVHQVCVKPEERGKGFCPILMQSVFLHIEKRHKETREVQIYCEVPNMAACKCYAKAFSDYHKTLRLPGGRKIHAFAKHFGS